MTGIDLAALVRSNLLRTPLVAGPGARLALPVALAERGWSRPLLLAGAHVAATAFFRTLVRELEAAGCPTTVVDAMPSPARAAAVEALADRFASERWDVIIGVGGGSTLDAAKAASLLVARGGRVKDHAIRRAGEGGAPAVRSDRRPFLPVITVPTTLSGSEANVNASIRDPEAGERYSLADPALLPVLVVLDPEALRSHRREILLASAFNALAHCIEGAYSTRHHLLGDAIAQSAGRMLSDAIDAAPQGSSDAVLLALQVGSVFAGALIKEVYVGMHHALCHALVSHCGLLHAQANGTMLPWTVGYNVDALARAGAADRLAVVARAIGVEERGQAAVALAAAIRERLCAMQGRAGIPSRLTPLGVRDAQIAALADYALSDRALDTNPVAMDRAAIEGIYREAL